jgi:uncharacterized protein YidB (DUF937 family)
MGLLDNLLGGALGNALGQAPGSASTSGGGAGTLAALLPVVLGMIAGQSSAAQPSGGLGGLLGGMLGGGRAGGGLASLLSRFEAAGLGEHVNSWVGTGANMPIAADAIGKVLGGDALSRIAQQAGLSESEVSQGLSQLLPHVVDHLTPNGQMPDAAQLGAGIEALRQKFGI